MSTAVSVDRQPRAGTRVDRRPIVLAAVASVMGGAVYLNALPNPFVLDDHLTVVTNPSIRDPWNIAEVVRGSLFRPVENMSFAVDHALWGFDPFGFHLTSLLLHVVNVALVFALAWRVHVDRGGVDDGARALGAFVAAALFAVHPLMTEAVGYVSGRAELLGAAFFVLALVLLRDGIVGGGRVRLASALLALCLALGSKETAAMFPLVALAYDRLLLREVPSRRYRLVRLHLPLIAVVLTAAAARTAIFVWIEQPSSRAALARMGSYLVVQFEVVWRYLALLAAPLSQSVLHVIGPSPRVSLLGAIALAGACLVVFRYRRAEPVLALGAAWFLLVLAPSSSLVPLQYAMAEHRTYLASVGVFLVAGAAVAAVDRRLASHPVARWAGVMALVVLLGTMSALTFARNQVWADPVGLWADAHRKSPSWQTSLALGDALRQQGDCDAAIDAYRDAVRRAPKRRSPYVRLHACLVREGRVAEAGEVVQEMRRLDPDFTKLCEEERALSAGRMNVEECRRRYRTRLGPA